jgi:hypothetical protein
MIRSILTLCVFISTFFLSAQAGEWNQHRGPFSNNLSDESITSANLAKIIQLDRLESKYSPRVQFLHLLMKAMPIP